ncbi:MAG: hypothetical protein IT495_15340 [Gammaproteobacteria bacterium]|nr:hypothetical protein [Gammaproteobacteria bacterium]
MTGMLASVTNVAEALLAVDGGADIIDLKDPARGALGALAPAGIARVVRALAGVRPLSATTGDGDEAVTVIADRVAATAALGVDLVKVGMPAGAAELDRLIDALAVQAAAGLALVAVLAAERGVDSRTVSRLGAAGFRGAMLDTLDKRRGSLRTLLDDVAIGRFVAVARAAGLFTGLAGSLTLSDVPALLAHRPDFLGFRGALCARGRRGNEVEAHALRAVRASIPPTAGTGWPGARAIRARGGAAA